MHFSHGRVQYLLVYAGYFAVVVLVCLCGLHKETTEIEGFNMFKDAVCPKANVLNVYNWNKIYRWKLVDGFHSFVASLEDEINLLTPHISSHERISQHLVCLRSYNQIFLYFLGSSRKSKNNSWWSQIPFFCY